MMEELGGLKCKDEYLDDYEEYSLATSANNAIGRGEKHHHLDYHLNHHQQYIDDAEDDDLFSRHKIRKLSKYEKCWSGEETEKLIQLWSEQQELYNPSLPAYFDRGKKNLLTKEIADKLETEEECVRKKMKSLQSYYCQLRRRTINLLDKANSVGGGSLKKPTWPFYDMLEFLNISSGGQKLTMASLPEHSIDDMVSSGSPHSVRSSPLTSYSGMETCSTDGQRLSKSESMTISMATVYNTSEENPRQSAGFSEANSIRSPHYVTPDFSDSATESTMIQIPTTIEQGNTMKMSERKSSKAFSSGNVSRSSAVPCEMTSRPLVVGTHVTRSMRGSEGEGDGEAREPDVSVIDPSAACNERHITSRQMGFEQNDNRHARTEIHQNNNYSKSNINNYNNNEKNSYNNNDTSSNNSRSSNVSTVTRGEDNVNTFNSPNTSHNGGTENTGASKSLSTPLKTPNDLSVSEDSIFGELVSKSIAKVPEGEIKEELKIEIQQLILAAKRKASVL